MHPRRSIRPTRGTRPIRYGNSPALPKPKATKKKHNLKDGSENRARMANANLDTVSNDNYHSFVDAEEINSYPDDQDIEDLTAGLNLNADESSQDHVGNIRASTPAHTAEEGRWHQLSQQMMLMNTTMLRMQEEMAQQQRQHAASERASLERERESISRERAAMERERTAYKLGVESAIRHNVATHKDQQIRPAQAELNDAPEHVYAEVHIRNSATATLNLSAEDAIAQHQPTENPIRPRTLYENALLCESQIRDERSTARIGSIGPPSNANSVTTTRTHEHRKLHDLPVFSGRPEDWPMFFNAFQATTDAYGYTDLENLIRLQKAVTSNARMTVEHVLIHPRHVGQAIETLRATFGRPELLIRSQIQAARLLPKIDENHLERLAPFAISVQNLAVVLDSNATQNYLGDPTLLDELVSKLPMSRRMDWASVASKIVPYPNITHFSKWLTEVARLVNFISLPTMASETDNNNSRPTTSKQSTQARPRHVLLNVRQETEELPETKCGMCAESHSTAICEQFLCLTGEERWDEVTHRQLCFCCLQPGHILPSCAEKRKCAAKGCSMWHHDLLHSKKPAERKATRSTKRDTRATEPTSSAPAPDPTTSTHAGISSNNAPATAPPPTILNCREMRSPVYFRIIPIRVFGSQRHLNTFALLDEGSSVTLMDASVAEYLQLDGPTTDLDIKWFGRHSTSEKSQKLSLKISGANDGDTKYEVNVQTVQNLSLPIQTVDSKTLKAIYPHLKTAPFEDYENAVPTMLIGLDHHHLTLPLKIVADHEQYGVVVTQTRLGWVVHGSEDRLTEQPVPPIVLHATSCDNDQDNELHNLVQAFFTTEDFGVKLPKERIESTVDTRARSLLASTTRRISNERFETGLLWKTDDVKLPNSFAMAFNRLRSVEAKMRRDPAYAAQYESQILSYVKKGYARKLSVEEANANHDRIWYLPHFSVKNPNKPNKFRLVFDAAAVANGVSLNTALLSGPDDNVPLTRILFQFRLGIVGVCADIREMFHQIRIRESDQQSQRFLWRNNDADARPDTYIMEVMTFGSTCSPASAQHVKNANAAEYATTCPAAVDAILNKHYVDDFVCSFANAEEAINVTSSVVDIHRRGGFDLRGFVSNSPMVLHSLGVETSSSDPVSMESDSTTEKILGMSWNTEDDTFLFQNRFARVHPAVVSGERRPSKREILSVAMSVFDPFGLLSDFMLTAKIILQDLWRIGVSWDEQVPKNINERWQSWRAEIHMTSLCRIPRCYSPAIKNTRDLQLHIFADASEVAFAAVAYWRIATDDGVQLAFVCGKSRCAPLKLLSIPRLELQAAVLATRLLKEIEENHDLNISTIVLWSDSQTVLKWIRSEQRRYKPFVAYRVSEIAENAATTCWRWCPTALNVADDATRIRPKPNFDPDSRWLKGPSWLLEIEATWPVEPPATNDEDGNVEEVRAKFVGVIFNATLIDINRFSNFNRLRRAIAWVWRFIENVRARQRKKEKHFGELLVNEIEFASRLVCRLVQREAFSVEYAALLDGRNVDKGELFKLNPKLDDEGVIRMHGRTDGADELYL